MRRTLFALALGLTLAGSLPAAAQPPSPDGAFAHAQEAARAGRWQQALDAFRAVWELAPTGLHAAELGRAELHVGLAREGAEHLQLALQKLPTAEVETRAWAQASLAQAKQHVVSLDVRASDPGATILLDGKVIGTSPLAGEVFIDGGSHRLDAWLDGFWCAPVTVHEPIGSSVEVALKLVRGPAPLVGILKPEGPGRPAAEPERSRVPILIGGLLTAVTAGGGALILASAPRTSDPQAMRTLAGINFGASGAFLAATLTYALWPASKTAPAAGRAKSIGLAPVVSPDGGGFVLAGSM